MKKLNNQGIAHLSYLLIAILVIGTISMIVWRATSSDSEGDTSQQQSEEKQDTAENEDSADQDTDESDADEQATDPQPENSSSQDSPRINDSNQNAQQSNETVTPEPVPEPVPEPISEPAPKQPTSVQGHAKATSGVNPETITTIELSFLINGASEGTCGMGFSKAGQLAGGYQEAAVQPFSSEFFDAEGKCELVVENPEGFDYADYNYTVEYIPASDNIGASTFSGTITIPFDPFS